MVGSLVHRVLNQLNYAPVMLTLDLIASRYTSWRAAKVKAINLAPF